MHRSLGSLSPAWHSCGYQGTAAGSSAQNDRHSGIMMEVAWCHKRQKVSTVDAGWDVVAVVVEVVVVEVDDGRLMAVRDFRKIYHALGKSW